MLMLRYAKRVIPLVAIAPLLFLVGCTTYTWPDGSQETVLGVVPEDENKRFEEQQVEGVRYRIPGEIPE
jgi:hypothetical protein